MLCYILFLLYLYIIFLSIFYLTTLPLTQSFFILLPLLLFPPSLPHSYPLSSPNLPTSSPYPNQVSEDMLRLVVEEAQRSVTGIDTGEGRMIKAVLDMQDTEVCMLSCCDDRLKLTTSCQLILLSPVFYSVLSSLFLFFFICPAIPPPLTSTISSPLLLTLHHLHCLFITHIIGV